MDQPRRIFRPDDPVGADHAEGTGQEAHRRPVGVHRRHARGEGPRPGDSPDPHHDEPRHHGSVLHGHAGACGEPDRRGRQGLSLHPVRHECRAHPDRGRMHRRRQMVYRQGHRLRQGAHGVRPSDRAEPGRSVPDRKGLRIDARRRIDGQGSHPQIRGRARLRRRGQYGQDAGGGCVLGCGQCLRADPWRLRLCGRIRRRAQVPRNAALSGRADLDQSDFVVRGRACARHAPLVLRTPMLPLEGLIVIAVEQAVAAPFCSSRLADAGAHVIKVERPEGDFARGYDAAAKGQSSYFVWLNRGKDSVVIDLATKEGRASLEELIAGADVLLQNLKPGSMDKLGFSLERLKQDYPALICCTISGYGDEGPYADRKAYDLLIQAESGLASITGGPEGPSRVGVSIVDIATGATAHASILEALIARGRTGKGADIRISMFDVMADWMAVPVINSEAGNPPKRMALAHPSIAPYGVFSSKDGKGILISIQSEREWKKLCAEVLGQPALPDDPRFSNMVERVRNRKLTDRTVGDIFATMTRDDLLKRLSDADIAFAEVNTMADLAVHPHLRRIEVDTPNGKVTYASPAAIFVGEPRHYGAVPGIGQHSELPKTPRARAKSS